MYEHRQPRVRKLPQLRHLPRRQVRVRLRQRAARLLRTMLRRVPGGAVHELGVHGDGGPGVHAVQLVLVDGGLLHGAGVLGERGRGVLAVHGVRGGAVRGDGVRGEQRRGVLDVRGVCGGIVRGAGLRRRLQPVRAVGVIMM
jgi:hypothetical protein